MASVDADVDTLGERLGRFGLGAEAGSWLDELASVTLRSGPARLPEDAALPELLRRLRVPTADDAGIAASIATARGGDVAWVVDRCRQLLVDGMGRDDPITPWPRFADPYFYVAVYLAAVPDVRAFHRDRGISDELSWAGMGDLGQQIWVHRRIFGHGGLHAHDWEKLPFRGLLYWLGRLQFNLARHSDGRAYLGVHIPDTGPLDPAECDASFEQAREFFRRHFPDWPVEEMVCNSWLLDPQLAEYLPETSNIMRFQRRFTLQPGGWGGDDSVVEFVFRKLNASVDELPQRTTLERAIVAHLRAGRHWNVVSGRLPF